MVEIRSERRFSGHLDRGTAIVRTAFARFDIRALALTSGALIAIVLMALTAAVVLQPPAPGRETGEHLQLLANYFPGYTVSWSGCLVGGAYSFVAGAVLGGFFGLSWNFMHVVYLMLVVIKRGRGAEL